MHHLTFAAWCRLVHCKLLLCVWSSPAQKGGIRKIPWRGAPFKIWYHYAINRQSKEKGGPPRPAGELLKGQHAQVLQQDFVPLGSAQRPPPVPPGICGGRAGPVAHTPAPREKKVGKADQQDRPQDIHRQKRQGHARGQSVNAGGHRQRKHGFGAKGAAGGPDRISRAIPGSFRGR